MATDIPTSEEFFRLIKRASRALRRHALWLGGALVALLAIGWLDVAVAVDLSLPLATTYRLLFAIGFWLLLIAGTAVLLIWPLLRRLKLEDVALRIEQAVGNMHNRLLTVLDLHRAIMVGNKKSNPDMVAALLRQTRAKLAGFHIRQLIDRVPLVRSLAGLAAVLCLALLLAVVFRESAPTALARILRPTADIPPVTWLQIAAPGDLSAPAGDPLTIVADVTRGEVDTLSLHLQQPDGQWVVYPMQPDGGQRFTYTLSGVMSDYRYKISGGGTWTSEYQIHMVPRPIVDSVTTAIRLPAYMRHEELLPVADDARRIEAPIDSHVVFEAQVSGDVARGEIVLLRRSVSTEETVQDEEHVWFDDDLPADANATGAWRWSTARAFSGLKSFTLGRGNQPLSFTSRLNPLDVPAQGIFFLMVWLDGSHPPGRISLGLQHDNQTRTYEWGEASPPVNGQPPATPLGPLPQPMGWVRLEVPANALGSAGGAWKLRGMTLAVDHGEVFFDRPGFLTRKRAPVDTIATEAIDSRSMLRDEASGRWMGEVLVAADMLLTLRFHSSLKQASAQREPLEVIAKQDQPPSIVVEKPNVDVVLPAVQPLPISARVLDDWGVAAVGMRLGPSESGLSAPRWLEEERELTTSRMVTLAIDSAAEHLAPGQSLWYCLVAKDSKGQLAETKTYKLSIAPPDRAGAPETAKLPESLEQLRKLLAEMLKAPTKDRESAEFVASLPKPLSEALDAEGQFRKPDGSPLQAEEVRKLVEQTESQLTPEQKGRLAELTAELDRRQQELRRLAEMLKQATQKSVASPLALEQESKLLAEFAGQAQQMASELNPPTAAQGNAARLERELKTERTVTDQPERLAELERQLAQLEAARQLVASDPRLAQQQLAQLAAQVVAAAAARELDELAADLETRGHKLQTLQKEAGSLAGQSALADDKKLTAISQSQTQLDQQAIPAIDQLRGILGSATEEKSQPLALWTPPGKPLASAPGKQAATSTEKTDQGQGQGQGEGTGQDKQSGQSQPDGKSPDTKSSKSGSDEKWWDKPSGVPAASGSQASGSQDGQGDRDLAGLAGTEQKSEALPTKPGQVKPTPPTPRGQLTAHQAQLQESLSANAGEALQSASTVRELAERLRQAAGGSELSGQDQSGGDQPGHEQPGHDQPGKSPAGKNQPGKNPPGKGPDGKDAGGKDQGGKDQGGKDSGGKDSGGKNQPGNETKPSASDDVEGQPGESGTGGEHPPNLDAGQILADAATQKALAMAQRMHAQSRFAKAGSRPPQAGQEKPPEQTGQPTGGTTPSTTGARPGNIMAGQAPLGSDPRGRANFYQLPPRMRGPLLEGMQERGPEGYQSMIDAYFRELNKEIK